jgi:hypothetical protein
MVVEQVLLLHTRHIMMVFAFHWHSPIDGGRCRRLTLLHTAYLGPRAHLYELGDFAFAFWSPGRSIDRSLHFFTIFIVLLASLQVLREEASRS